MPEVGPPWGVVMPEVSPRGYRARATVETTPRKVVGGSKAKGEKATKEHSQHSKLAFRRVMQNVRQKALNAKNKDGSASALNLRQVFSSFDIDGSGFLDELEFETVTMTSVAL